MPRPMSGVQKGVMAGLAAVVLLAVAWGAYHRGQPISTSIPASAPGQSQAGGGRRVVVEVAGAVAQPGVYTLPEGSRLRDALTAAGGLLPTADPARLNQARPLRDGEKVTVKTLSPEAVTPAPAATPAAERLPPPTSAAQRAEPSTSPAPAETTPTAPLSLNAATREELLRLPGMDETTVADLLRYRQQRPFRRAEELMLIRGISPQDFEKLRAYVRP